TEAKPAAKSGESGLRLRRRPKKSEPCWNRSNSPPNRPKSVEPIGSIHDQQRCEWTPPLTQEDAKRLFCPARLAGQVDLIDLVHLVSFIQPKNQTNQIGQTTVFLCWRNFSA